MHVIHTCLKVTTAISYFCHSKNHSNMMGNIFNSISIYSWKKIFLLTNIRSECVIKEINLNFLTPWKMANFFLQKCFIFNMITDSISVEKQRTLARRSRYICKNSWNLDCKDSICFGIFKVAYKWRTIWDEFLLPIFYKMFS